MQGAADNILRVLKYYQNRGKDVADALAAAITRHIAATTGAELPTAASVIWQARVTRPLKTDADKPLTSRIVSAIRSWPSARGCDLAQALVEIEAILVDNENEIFHEVIYAEISRAYS